MNNGLTYGSQIDYINQARALGYAVIVTNTNLNTDESSRSIYSPTRAIRVSMEIFFT
jgi:bifunctional ADP-heptose synthase (sugar kinase/adenylyltransferase)